MGCSRLLLTVSACVALTHGAPLSSELGLVDQLLDKFSANILNMESMLEGYGFTRNKRSAGSYPGYKTFGFGGIQAGIKWKDEQNKPAGGDAFILIEDVQSKFPKAHSSEIEVHVQFDGKASPADGIFDFEVDYHLTHSDGEGVEEGELKITRNKVGNKWETEIKTTAKPFNGKTIIPANINNADITIESDRTTFFKIHYVNPAKNRDFLIDLERTPGKKLDLTVTNNGNTLLQQTIEVTAGDLTMSSGKLTIKLTGFYTGSIDYGTGKFKVILNRGGYNVLQVMTKYKKIAGETNTNNKVNINNYYANLLQDTLGLSGALAVRTKRTPDSFKIKIGVVPPEENDKKAQDEEEKPKNEYILSLGYGEGQRNIEIQKNKEAMITYTSSIIKNTNNAAVLDFEAESKLVLSEKSILYGIINDKSPLGGFKERKNHVKFFLDKANRNLLFRKFKIDIDMFKDNQQVLDFHADTTGKPYTFKLKADRLRALLPVDRQADGIEITIDHDIGKSIRFISNGFGGLELYAQRSANANGGIDFEAYTKKAGKEMMHYKLNTALINNPSKFKFNLKGDLTVDSQSILFKNIIANYKFLTPFNKRVGQIEIFVDKQNKNVILPKFKINAHVDKDGQEALEILFDTTTSPYQIKIHAPFIRNALGLSTNGVDMTVDHKKGNYLKVISNIPGFSGLKITTKGNTKELEFNGQPVGASEFSSTANSISFGATKAGDGKVITYLKDGDNIKVDIKWASKDPKKNTIDINVKGSRRNLDLTIKYDFSQIDFDPKTPSASTFELTATGNNPTFGQYSVSRKGSLNAGNNKVSLDWSGSAKWEKGPMADRSPVQTNFDLDFDAAAKDLTGTMSKSFNGKKYEVTFPKGSGLGSLPQFSLGG